MRLARGVTLIEVLVALVILSVGLLGFARLQAANLTLNNEAWLRSTATILASDLLDRARGNPDQVNVGGYDTAWGTAHAMATNCQTQSCTPAELANFDMAQWKAELASALPQGAGNVSRDNSVTPFELVVQVRWFERTAQASQTLELRAKP